MEQYCIVLSTFETEDQAKPVIDRVLSEKLAACIQVLNIGSHYVWNGALCNDKEVLVLFKTSSRLYEELKCLLEEIHPYDTPEIIRIPIQSGSEGYLRWIDEVTKQSTY